MSLAIGDAMPLVDGGASERLRQVTLAGAWRPEQQDVFALQDDGWCRLARVEVLAIPRGSLAIAHRRQRVEERG